MLTLERLKKFVRAAADMLAKDDNLIDAEVYCSSSEQVVVRLNYTSAIPSRGVEEAKSETAQGLVVRIVTRNPPNAVGEAYEAGELSLASLTRALERARRAAVVNPDFPGLPPLKSVRNGASGASSDLLDATSLTLVRAGWSVIKAAIAELHNNPFEVDAQRNSNFILGGDLTLSKERVAIARARLRGELVDEDAHFRLNLVAFDEATNGKSAVSYLGVSRQELQSAIVPLASQLVGQARALANGDRPRQGRYRVVLGPQPVAEILNHIVLPSLTTRAFHSASSCYLGKFSKVVMDPRLSLIDDPRANRKAVRRTVSCEGIPTRRTTLVKDGKLVGLLSDFYYGRLLERDPDIARKLGRKIVPRATFAATCGYRLSDSGVRRFDAEISASASNVILKAKEGKHLKALMEAVGDGLYVGHVWYTYPINGQAAGDFTCTISGNSYRIRNGRPDRPIMPNCLRINGNVRDVFQALKLPESTTYPVALWGSPQAYYVPSLAVEGLQLSEIASLEE